MDFHKILEDIPFGIENSCLNFEVVFPRLLLDPLIFYFHGKSQNCWTYHSKIDVDL